jgi:hypothetical protein
MPKLGSGKEKKSKRQQHLDDYAKNKEARIAYIMEWQRLNKDHVNRLSRERYAKKKASAVCGAVSSAVCGAVDTISIKVVSGKFTLTF